MTTSIFNLENKTAVVIGGTTGIGRALSLGLADAGADVIASARRQEQVDETAAEVERRGAAVYLVSDAVSFGTGTSLVVDGGFLASGVNQ
jgi:NAD(P)-dependent dehydrogenase (short-subunit alcohol dehydrogenase family)